MFLQIKNTTIGYQKPLISEVNASLDFGDVCLLIGNNGVGKTTLIKSILNQIPTLKGDIFINDKNVKKLTDKEIAEQIAVVFSKAQIPANYTTEDLISLGKFIHLPYYYKLEKEHLKDVNNIISQLKLEEYRTTSLQKLSDGNLQKAFIGRALAQNSPVIILDEPTTHLDEENKIIILKLLRDLAKNHDKIILFSSHDWRLAKEFADKHLQIVYPSYSVKINNPVAVVKSVTEQKGTTALAQAYLKGLWDTPAQEIIAKNYLRPVDTAVFSKYQTRFPVITTFEPNDVFGSWDEIMTKFFKDGAIFDQLAVKK